MRVDRVNLLPKRLKPQIVNAKSALIIGWVTCVLVMAIAISFQTFRLKKLDSQFTTLTEAANAAEQRAQEATKVASHNSGLSQRITLSQQFLSSKVTWTGAFKELSLLIPKKVWISNFTLKNNQAGPFIEIVGSAPSQDKIATFLDSLELSFYFRNVSLRKSEKLAAIKPDLYKFELEVIIPQLIARGPDEKGK